MLLKRRISASSAFSALDRARSALICKRNITKMTTQKRAAPRKKGEQAPAPAPAPKKTRTSPGFDPLLNQLADGGSLLRRFDLQLQVQVFPDVGRQPNVTRR